MVEIIKALDKKRYFGILLESKPDAWLSPDKTIYHKANVILRDLEVGDEVEIEGHGKYYTRITKK